MRIRDPRLEQTYRNLRDKDKRAAAEVAYVLGELSKRTGDYVEMNRYRDESMTLFRELEVNTLEAACPIYESINDVPLPNLIHEGVVATRLTVPE
jgi:hypothetical protein